MLDALTCLTDNIYYEAAREPFAGKVAVGQVTLNRAADPKYPADICGVVYYRRIIGGKKVAAFSWTLGRAWRDRSRRDWVAYGECQWIASKLLSGTYLGLPIDGSVEYYHADYITVHWRHQFVGQIGHHLFYRR